jgi:hypothetical protein
LRRGESRTAPKSIIANVDGATDNRPSRNLEVDDLATDLDSIEEPRASHAMIVYSGQAGVRPASLRGRSTPHSNVGRRAAAAWRWPTT